MMALGFLQNITLTEPRVLISDIILSTACFWCYFDFKNKTEICNTHDVVKNWRRFFLFEGISFLIGAIAHGFYAYFGDVMHFLGWYASLAGIFYFTWGMVKAANDQPIRPIIYFLFSAVIVSAVTSVLFRAFWVIVAYSFSAMVVVIVINRNSKIISLKNRHSKGILIGTAFFIVAAATHVFDLSVLGVSSTVLSHAVIAVGILFFGRGCLDTVFEICKENNDKTHQITV